MESFAPEFAQYWLNGQLTAVSEAKAERHDDEANAQQAALRELAERVAAARSVI
jgi:hypothetical protein